MIVGAEDTVQDTALAVLGRLLESDEVLLSTGKVARLRRTSALHDTRCDQLVARAGYDAGGIDGPTHARFRVLLALATIDGKPVEWPRGQRQDMDIFLARFTSGDAERISHKYCVMHGYKPEQASPRAASGQEGGTS